MPLNDIEPSILRWTHWHKPEALHNVIQAVMLFEDCYLLSSRWMAGGITDTEDAYDRKTYAAKYVRISALIDRGIATFSDTYDFGDNWLHTISVASWCVGMYGGTTISARR